MGGEGFFDAKLSYDMLYQLHMSYNVTVCQRCGEHTYDPDYKCCLNEDCRLLPVAEGMHLTLVIAGALTLALAVASHWLN